MKKRSFLLGALILAVSLTGCARVQARVKIREANDLYEKEQYAAALKQYEGARRIDPSFADLDRLIGYSLIGMYQPDNTSPANEKVADRAILELQQYLRKKPKDMVAREALINLFLNANRTSQAIDYFVTYLKENPADLTAVKSIATLYAKQGNFEESLNWYEKITLLDSKNPEAFYVFGVVCYEKVAKDPPADLAERLQIIERGKAALSKAIAMKSDYFEAVVYLNLLYREQAKVELDPVRQAELMQQAEQYRNRAMEINKERKKLSK